jgi:G:T/U-mismatch repair DNA glycosylase
MFITKPRYSEESITWEKFYVPPNASKLLIGTFPTSESKRQKTFDFFYPNSQNPMWEMLAKIANEPFNKSTFYLDKANAYKILNKLNLGITDMAFKVYRLGVTSQDQGLFPLEFVDIFQILQKHTSINKLILTSKSGPNSVVSWFKNYCWQNNVKVKVTRKTTKFKLNLDTKVYDVVIVPSTSNTYRRKDFDKSKFYAEAILEN